MSRVIGWGPAAASREAAVERSLIREPDPASPIGLAEARLQRRFPKLNVFLAEYREGHVIVAACRPSGSLVDCGTFELARFDLDAAGRAILERFYTTDAPA